MTATSSIRMTCPRTSCSGPVYVPADSHAELVDCTSCGAHLVTRRALDGSVALQEIEP